MMHVAVPAADPGQAYDAAGLLTAPTLIFAGDSMTADSQMGAPGAGVTTYTASHVTWLRWLTARRYYWDPSLVFATAGYTAADWIAAHQANCVAAVKAARARGAPVVVVLRLGTNDAGSGRSLAAAAADFDTILGALHGAGAITIAYLIAPRTGASALSAASEKVRLGLNAYLARMGAANARKVIPFDPNPFVVDAGTGAARAGYQRDGLHGTSLGYAAEATPLAAVLNSLAPPTWSGQLDADDTFDATSNPYGNKLANGLMAGTGGYNEQGGAASTGTGATGWSFGVWNGGNTGPAVALTAAWSKVASPTTAGLELQQVTLGGTAGSGEFAQIRQSTPPTGYAAGDVVEAEMVVEWDAGLTNVAAVAMILNANYAVQAFEGASAAAYGPLPGGPMRLIVSTAPFALTSAALGGALNLSIRVQGGSNTGAVAGVVRIGQVRVRKVN